MRIATDFDGGSIRSLGSRHGEHALALKRDNRAPIRQWFSFAAEGPRGRAWHFAIVNAGQSAYPDAWDGYRVAASDDGSTWRRLRTEFDGEVLRFGLRSRTGRGWFALFPPYSSTRAFDLVAAACRKPWLRLLPGAVSVQGRAVHLLAAGDLDAPRRRLWIVARQHPGETMASWFVEGLLDRLMDDGDEGTRALLSGSTVFVVPVMNPDGAFLGNHRTNAAGEDLNRSWLDPDGTTPEVLGIRERMLERGADLVLDVHGDEREPFVFLAGCEGNPGYSERQRQLEGILEESLARASPDFEGFEGYSRDEPGQADLRTLSNWAGEQFDCLAMTLEMPFKDNLRRPDRRAGWSPERSMALGAACVEALASTAEAME